jgi:hypothetical protein
VYTHIPETCTELYPSLLHSKMEVGESPQNPGNKRRHFELGPGVTDSPISLLPS